MGNGWAHVTIRVTGSALTGFWWGTSPWSCRISVTYLDGSGFHLEPLPAAPLCAAADASRYWQSRPSRWCGSLLCSFVSSYQGRMICVPRFPFASSWNDFHRKQMPHLPCWRDYWRRYLGHYCLHTCHWQWIDDEDEDVPAIVAVAVAVQVGVDWPFSSFRIKMQRVQKTSWSHCEYFPRVNQWSNRSACAFPSVAVHHPLHQYSVLCLPYLPSWKWCTCTW